MNKLFSGQTFQEVMSHQSEIIVFAFLKKHDSFHSDESIRISGSGNQFRWMDFRRIFLKKPTQHDFGDYLHLYLYLFKNSL